MASASKTVYDGGTGIYATARTRCDCLDAWASSLNGGGGALIINGENSSRSALIMATIVSIIGLSTIAGFYFLKRKKETY
jgi:hypothetical protein